MIEQIDQELLEIQLKLKEKQHYQDKLQGVLVERQNLEQKRIKLKEELIKEKKDVTKLEKISFANIWYSFIGAKSEKLQKEKNEYSQAEYNYKLMKETIDRIEEEIKYFKEKIQGINDLDTKYQQLLKEKEQEIMDHHSELYDSLSEINQKIIKVERYQKEIKEAIVAGNDVMDALVLIKKSLDKAHGWGTFDIFGGGLLADMAKHSHIDEARRQIQNLHYLFNKFTRELKDVDQTVSIEINISGTLKFADYFFDGFISDMMVQSRINNSLEQVRKAQATVNKQIISLQQQFNLYKERITKIQKEKSDLLKPKN